ncbi:cAMP-binding domain of CRP or a regulatory subunit of cAMP-dependent protein kinases [Chitinophaga sp. YR627]|uniref:Crp/Fnr family transcriptional regulator n=1 Tax=Chitinophaga sp. YR627 TaxID=1881041 RepID=UPI0008F18A8D|nr:Crp/Fnr family transcriptional regulator [Chitinophaga sp. YR627]SFN22685.1 cAMP-binding domain of CRP or a regulatory subunit of cAMP-dependent protein kinases [Chitinophaga sp. YR627]
MHPALKQYLAARIELSPAHEALVEQCFVARSTGRNETIVPAGTIAKYLFFVIKGCLRVFLTNEEGGESTRFLIFEGQMGTAFPSFVQKEPSVAAIQSPEPSELLMLRYEDREMLFNTIPGWERMERLEVEKAYVNAIRRIEGLITTDSRERYQVLLRDHPEMIKRLPSRMIADYLGISPETLSRLKAKK